MEKNKLINSTKVIAEIANSHQGSAINAINLGNKCINSGVHAIKFQVYFADELLHKSHKRYNHFQNQSFSSSQWNKIFKNINKKNSKIYCDIFGEKSFLVANNKYVDGFKIHSSDLINRNLLDKLCKVNKKEIFLSTGGSTLREISYAVSICNKLSIKPVLMHGYQSYPTKVEDTNLNRILLFKKVFKNNCSYGYQDHIAGDDEMSSIIPFVSLSMNINFIEKHVTLNRSDKGVDYYSSIEPDQLKNFLKNFEKVKKSFGTNLFTFSRSEKKYRNEVKKIWFTKKNLKSNSKVNKNNLIMLRPPKPEIAPNFIENFKDRNIKEKVQGQISITRSLFKNNIAAIIVARYKSKRLPGKALKKINGETLIEHLIKRLKRSKRINKIIVATPKHKEDNKIIRIAKKNKVLVFRGDEKNVLKRMCEAAKKFKSNIVIRVTGDDILIDPVYLDKLINFHLNNNLEYSNNKDLPGGTEVEIFNLDLLNFLMKCIKEPNNTEYLTFFINDYKDQFINSSLVIPKKHISQHSLTIDTSADFLFVKNFLNNMKKRNLKYEYTMDHIINYLKKNKRKKNIINKTIKLNTELEWEKIVKQ